MLFKKRHDLAMTAGMVIAGGAMAAVLPLGAGVMDAPAASATSVPSYSCTGVSLPGTPSGAQGQNLNGAVVNDGGINQFASDVAEGIVPWSSMTVPGVGYATDNLANASAALNNYTTSMATELAECGPTSPSGWLPSDFVSAQSGFLAAGGESVQAVAVPFNSSETTAQVASAVATQSPFDQWLGSSNMDVLVASAACASGSAAPVPSTTGSRLDCYLVAATGSTLTASPTLGVPSAPFSFQVASIYTAASALPAPVAISRVVVSPSGAKASVTACWQPGNWTNGLPYNTQNPTTGYELVLSARSGAVIARQSATVSSRCTTVSEVAVPPGASVAVIPENDLGGGPATGAPAVGACATRGSATDRGLNKAFTGVWYPSMPSCAIPLELARSADIPSLIPFAPDRQVTIVDHFAKRRGWFATATVHCLVEACHGVARLVVAHVVVVNGKRRIETTLAAEGPYAFRADSGNNVVVVPLTAAGRQLLMPPYDAHGALFSGHLTLTLVHGMTYAHRVTVLDERLITLGA
jgi:hypothetical protein